MQVLAFQEGGEIQNEGNKEFGYAKINLNNQTSLFIDTSDSIDVWMSHGDKVISFQKVMKL